MMMIIIIINTCLNQTLAWHDVCLFVHFCHTHGMHIYAYIIYILLLYIQVFIYDDSFDESCIVCCAAAHKRCFFKNMPSRLLQAGYLVIFLLLFLFGTSLNIIELCACCVRCKNETVSDSDNFLAELNLLDSIKQIGQFS